jgi:hypothetical protein
MGRARKKYAQEYKDEAPELILCHGRPVAEITWRPGINEATLSARVSKTQESGN